jgi:hypothetical protein
MSFGDPSYDEEIKKAQERKEAQKRELEERQHKRQALLQKR